MLESVYKFLVLFRVVLLVAYNHLFKGAEGVATFTSHEEARHVDAVSSEEALPLFCVNFLILWVEFFIRRVFIVHLCEGLGVFLELDWQGVHG